MADGIVGEFFDLKAETDADLLAIQCGDFYEFFADDAETVADELDLKLSRKSSHGSSYPMAGVPVDDLTPYLAALVERGYRVAVADQYETDDGHAREVTRVATPGTLLETTDAEARYLAAVVRAEDVEGTQGGNRGDRGDGESAGPYGLAFVDVTTGRFLVAAVPTLADARSELYRFDPAELLPGPAARNDDALLTAVREGTDASVTAFEAAAFGPGRAAHAVREQFGSAAADSVGLDDGPAVRAAGAALEYVAETGTGVLASITRLRTYAPDDGVELDATTQRNLELTETMTGGDGDGGSLLATVDHTVTAPGGRLLRERLTRPRRDRGELDRRLDAVGALTSAALARDRLRDLLADAADLERLSARAASGSADPRGLAAVRDTLALVPALASAVEETDLADTPVADVITRPDGAAARELHAELDAALRDEPPGTVADGAFRRGYDDELDDLIERHEAVREWIDSLAAREKRRHGLSHVTVDRNRTDGYYIQVGKSAADDVPDAYREIKTLKNSKRFTTDELEDREREILRLESAREELERELFAALRDRVANRADLLQAVGRTIAELDAFASLAEHAAANGWTRPELATDGPLVVEAGRHPVVERTTEFVANSLRLDRERRFRIVTGPNMSGKSTYLRQAALIVLLAQAGSFVPADRARVGLVDGIYTRVGALDELAEGRSTFMVEMEELSRILNAASDDSLVILDEVGRGTATYDGVAIAWAATEYLSAARAGAPSPKTLFATHYHELTSLADHIDGVGNAHLAAEERDGDVTFLRTVRDGPADRSYGIHVAELAGVPDPVVDRAREVLDRLRADEAIEVRGGSRGGQNDQDDPAGSRQVVFDLGSGRLRAADGADSAGPDGAGDSNEPDGASGAREAGWQVGADGAAGPDSSAGGLDPEAAAVLAELTDTAVAETPPVELMGRVQAWQERLDGIDLPDAGDANVPPSGPGSGSRTQPHDG